MGNRALHGKPRYTDIDILVCSSRQNAAKLLAVLEAFGFSSLDISQDDFLKPNYIIQLGFEPNRLDLLTGISGVDFEDAFQRRESVAYNGVRIWFISAEDLIANKLAAGRDQDLVDAKILGRLKKR